MELIQLADRIEALKGPDREVDSLVAVALGFATAIHPTKPERCAWHDSGGLFIASPTFTESMDAAMTTIPHGCITSLARQQRFRKPEWTWGLNDGRGVTHFGTGASAAIAIVSTSLRALAVGE